MIRRINCPKCGRKIVMMDERIFIAIGGKTAREVAMEAAKETAKGGGAGRETAKGAKRDEND